MLSTTRGAGGPTWRFITSNLTPLRQAGPDPIAGCMTDCHTPPKNLFSYSYCSAWATWLFLPEVQPQNTSMHFYQICIMASHDHRARIWILSAKMEEKVYGSNNAYILPYLFSGLVPRLTGLVPPYLTLVPLGQRDITIIYTMLQHYNTIIEYTLQLD